MKKRHSEPDYFSSKARIMDLPQNTKSKLVQIYHISMNENEKVKIRPGRYKI
jgi:hypothetical protein